MSVWLKLKLILKTLKSTTFMCQTTTQTTHDTSIRLYIWRRPIDWRLHTSEHISTWNITLNSSQSNDTTNKICSHQTMEEFEPHNNQNKIIAMNFCDANELQLFSNETNTLLSGNEKYLIYVKWFEWQ